MAIVKVKIHPALGIARVGNSPEEFFIGPERPWDHSIPEGGYKDHHCRVKRQAARFRIFAYYDDGTTTEITEKKANISWTVHLVNKKASVRNRNLKPEDPAIPDLVIDPGPRTLTGPNIRQQFDTGQIKFPGAASLRVPLGESRTDDVGRLLVLGGFGHSESPTTPPKKIEDYYENAGWYDDTSDGKINATVQIRETHETFNAEGAWVVVAPPKFAPGLDNVITLYDVLFDMAVRDIAVEKRISEPKVTSYSQDIYPILERARTVRWVQRVRGAHTWSDPVVDRLQRNAIFSRVSSDKVSTDMPRLNGTGLTPTQFKHLERWNNGTFSNDWTGPPEPSANITPEGMDRAALENAVGGAFAPGIEVGGIFECPILNPSNYIAPFRLNHSSLKSGDLTAYMALPWQADFYACQEYWWPVPRPNHVLPPRSSGSRIAKVLRHYVAWDRDVGNYEAMVKSWHTLGFVIKQGNEYVEVDRCIRAWISLLTTTLNFRDVQQGPMGMSRTTSLPIIFEVNSSDIVILEFLTGPKHSRLKFLDPLVAVGPTTGSDIATARLWVTYETGPVGEVLDDEVVIRDRATYRTWNIYIAANTVDRKATATALVLDRGFAASVPGDLDDTRSNYKSMQEALALFADLALERDGVAVITYGEDSQLLQDVTPMGPPANPFDQARLSIRNILVGRQLKPSGLTSIGAGISEGLRVLNAVRSAYDNKALLVLTYEKENHSPWLADVEPKINLPIYSVGLGLPQNISTTKLQAISGNSGGYLLTIGNIHADPEKHTIFSKYMLQIYAKISNALVVLDSNGDLIPGFEYRIPFNLTEADTGMDVILLSRSIQHIDFRLQTPIGFIIEPRQIGGRLLHVISNNASFYRVVLPLEMSPMRFDRAGTWHVLLIMRETNQTQGPELRSSSINTSSFETVSRKVKSSSSDRTMPFDLLVHVYSDLTFTPYVQQNSYEPGSTISLYASISESGVPLHTGATSTWVEVTRPDNSNTILTLKEVDDGQFSATFRSTISGIYRFRVRASGRSKMGYPFQREQTLTSAVWIGGNDHWALNRRGNNFRSIHEHD